MQRRDAMVNELKHHLRKAQHRIKQFTDKHRTDREFSVGDWVWLKLQPYRKKTVSQRSNQKLAAKWFGPFQILMKIGKVAYKLRLPEDAQIHNVFHVSQLKAFRGILPDVPSVPAWLRGKEATTIIEPQAILQRRVVKSQNMAKVQYLVQWNGFPASEASWEYADDFESKFPSFVIQT
ncbi:hypothetical protein RND81_12G053000 [Saponaria officinalis]|uniref:Chromo domain-containing protein n=1 Tax=Saponaria officinalis TaxID=3572 RepID=A0AAW1H6P4_SAPOF